MRWWRRQNRRKLARLEKVVSILMRVSLRKGKEEERDKEDKYEEVKAERSRIIRKDRLKGRVGFFRSRIE